MRCRGWTGVVEACTGDEFGDVFGEVEACGYEDHGEEEEEQGV